MKDILNIHNMYIIHTQYMIDMTDMTPDIYIYDTYTCHTYMPYIHAIHTCHTYDIHRAYAYIYRHP